VRFTPETTTGYFYTLKLVMASLVLDLSQTAVFQDANYAVFLSIRQKIIQIRLQ
jgi:hypothetical protein